MALLDEILAWTENSLPLWQRDAARRLFQEQQGLADKDYEDLYALLKSAHGLPDPDNRAPVPLAAEHLPAKAVGAATIPASTAAGTAMKPAGDCFCDEEAQGWNRVGHMPLCPSGGREARNPGVRKALVVERGFFWSRHG